MGESIESPSIADRRRPSDGALSPDGTNDLGFIAEVDAPIAALFLVGVDDSGKPTGTFQADTLVGQSEGPAELGAKPGGGTSGLGVFEADKALSSTDGTLGAVATGPHHFTLYVAPSGHCLIGFEASNLRAATGQESGCGRHAHQLAQVFFSGCACVQRVPHWDAEGFDGRDLARDHQKQSRRKIVVPLFVDSDLCCF